MCSFVKWKNEKALVVVRFPPLLYPSGNDFSFESVMELCAQIEATEEAEGSLKSLLKSAFCDVKKLHFVDHV